MFEDFKKAVLHAYTEKKANHQLSDNLLSPTKAKLRKECLSILKDRYDKKDDEAINAFFNPEGKYENHEISISKFELDGFSALRNFLSGQPDIRREETIKLLAWLIDFEPRPYVFEQTYTTPEEIVEEPEKVEEALETIEDSEEVFIDPEPVPELTIPQSNKLWIYTSAIVLVLLLITSIVYREKINKRDNDKIANEVILKNEMMQTPVLFIKNTQSRPADTSLSAKAKKECMYWTGDHYEAINCNEEIGDTTKFVINVHKVANFKKINTPDTLTKNSIGKVYYVKINGDIEYFTEEGFHPVYTERKLKKLSNYMLDKYISSKL